MPAKNDSGTFGAPAIRNAGWIPKDTPVGQALFTHAKAFADSLAGKVIIVERDVEPELDDSMATNPEM